MSSFAIWLLSIIGVVILGVLIDVILPEGKINKYIKGIFAFIVMLVVISPLTKIDSVNVSLENLVENHKINLDEDYIFTLNQKIIQQLNDNIIKDAKLCGLNNISLNILSDIDNFELKINQIDFFLYDMVIDKKAEHINKYQILYDIVNKYIKIDKEYVNFYE